MSKGGGAEGVTTEAAVSGPCLKCAGLLQELGHFSSHRVWQPLGNFGREGGPWKETTVGPFVSLEARTQRKDEVEVGLQRACFFPLEPASPSQRRRVLSFQTSALLLLMV